MAGEDSATYELASDPWEVHNLTGDPAYASDLNHLRETLDQWMKQTGDMSSQTEDPAAMVKG